MPCSSGYEGQEADELREKLELATRVACDMAQYVGQFQALLLKPETQAWIHEHEKADRERLKREREEADRLHRRKKALKKLTPEERRLLGI